MLLVLSTVFALHCDDDFPIRWVLCVVEDRFVCVLHFLARVIKIFAGGK